MGNNIEELLVRRSEMVELQIKGRGIRDQFVLTAMQTIPRHRFVLEDQQELAYNDSPLYIGYGQTISQPYIVAYMTEKAELTPYSIVLEIGTGSGYQTAILAELASKVYTIEIIEELSLRAQNTLNQLGYNNISYKIDDGNIGWPEYAPYDVILVAACASVIPKELLKQLKIGGRLITPIYKGFCNQELIKIVKQENDFTIENLGEVSFVPLTNKGGE